MQINTRYHLKNFKDLSHLVEPEENVKYAAIYLLKLYKKHKSWNEAVSRYHSSIPKRKKNYLKKVYTYWNDLRQRKIVIKNSYYNRDEKAKIKFFREILKKYKTSELNLYGFASDQSPRKNKANYWGMFLNNYVPIHTGAETIAKKYNMAVVFMDVQKIKRGYYEVSFVTITEEPKKFSDFEITERFIELLEKQIINKPEYYTWTHKRFKHRKTISN